jgi:ParB-like chromosome segregation protein Spo0J
MEMNHTIKLNLQAILVNLMSQSFEDQVEIQNLIKQELHKVSPFKSEPVDCVIWVKHTDVTSNDYNPNAVAPPEMQLLEVSILNDGYTQPIVTWVEKQKREIIDGFHRSRVGKESSVIQERVFGYLPVVTANETQTDKGNRIASTIRHNRARGKHAVSAMVDIVIELKKRNWSEARIGKELGMDEDEILRLCQISGLAEAFENEDFSTAWESAIHANDIIDIEFENNDNTL